jgi:hypothetical protein
VYAPFYSSSLSPAQVRPSDGTTAAASLTNITRTGPGNPPGPLLSGVPQTISYTWDLTALSFDWDTYSHYDFGGIQLCSNGTSIPAGTVIYFDDISVSYTSYVLAPSSPSAQALPPPPPLMDFNAAQTAAVTALVTTLRNFPSDFGTVSMSANQPGAPALTGVSPPGPRGSVLGIRHPRLDEQHDGEHHHERGGRRDPHSRAGLMPRARATTATVALATGGVMPLCRTSRSLLLLLPLLLTSPLAHVSRSRR